MNLEYEKEHSSMGIINIDTFMERMNNETPSIIFEWNKDIDILECDNESVKAYLTTVDVLYNIKTEEFEVQLSVPYWVSYTSDVNEWIIEYNPNLRYRSELAIKKIGNTIIDKFDLKDNEFYFISYDANKDDYLYRNQNVNNNLYSLFLEIFLSNYNYAFELTEEQEKKCIECINKEEMFEKIKKYFE